MKKKISFIAGIAFAFALLGMFVFPKPSFALVCSADSCTNNVLWSGCFGETDELACRSDGGTCSGGNCIQRSCTTISNTCSSNSTGCSSLACQQVAITYSCSGSFCIQSANYSGADYCGGCGDSLACQDGRCVAPTPTPVPPTSTPTSTPIPCGASGQACCGGNFCNSGLICQFGACDPIPTPTPTRTPTPRPATPTPVPCGSLGQSCCGGSNCYAPLICVFGACENPPPTPTKTPTPIPTRTPTPTPTRTPTPLPCGGLNQNCCGGNSCPNGANLRCDFDRVCVLIPTPTSIPTRTPTPTLIPPTRTPTPTLPPGVSPTTKPITVTIQGRHLDENESTLTRNIGQSVTLSNGLADTTSLGAWDFSTINPGTYTVTAKLIPGYTIYNSVCEGCSAHFSSSYKQGNKVILTLPFSDAIDYADIYFKYVPTLTSTPTPAVQQSCQAPQNISCGINNSNPTWASLDGVTKYRLDWCYKNANFSADAFGNNFCGTILTSGTSANLNFPQSSTPFYEVRVRSEISKDCSTVGEWSVIKSCTRDSSISTPTPTPTPDPNSSYILGKHINSSNQLLSIQDQKVTIESDDGRYTETSTASPNWSFNDLASGHYKFTVAQITGFKISHTVCSSCEADDNHFIDSNTFSISISPKTNYRVFIKYTPIVDVSPTPPPPSFSSSVFPSRGFQGTFFEIDAKADPNQKAKFIIIGPGTTLDLDISYDGSGNGFYNNGNYTYIFFSNDSTPVGEYLVTFIIDGKKVGNNSFKIIDKKITEASCISITKNGDSSNNIDLVIAPNGYQNDEMDKFRQEIIPNHINSLFSKDPFSLNKDKFNIWFLNEAFDLECSLENSWNCISNIEESINPICPFADKILILDKEGSGGYTHILGRTAVTRGASYSGSDVRTTPHELGHSIGGLADEYSYFMHWTSQTNLPNCDVFACPKWCSGSSASVVPECSKYDTQTNCEKESSNGVRCVWLSEKNICDFPYYSGIEFGQACEKDTACYYGCGGRFGYRSSQYSIMGDPPPDDFNSQKFNSVSKKQIQKMIDSMINYSNE